MKNVEININTPGVAERAQLISKIGSNLGTQFGKVEVRVAWAGGKDGFEKDKLAVESGARGGFILTKSPQRFLLRNKLVTACILTKDELDNTLAIKVNPHEDGTADITLPITENTLQIMGKTTRDAIIEAIKGEKDAFFLDLKSLANILNEYNRRQITAIEELITNLQKIVGTLKNDISENEAKAKQAELSWINSALPQTVDMPGGTNVHLAVTQEED